MPSHLQLQTDQIHDLFSLFAVAMITAAQGDVVIDMNERAVMKTEVRFSNKISSSTFDFIFTDMCFCLSPTFQFQAPKVRFSHI